jgi:phosphoglycolate phosphatase-like HAD superfamily hydrolase
MKLNLSEATRLQACIVDLDGTLVDTLGDFEVALNHMLATLDRPPVTRTVIGQLVGKGSEHLIRSVLAMGSDSAVSRIPSHPKTSSTGPGVPIRSTTC